MGAVCEKDFIMEWVINEFGSIIMIIVCGSLSLWGFLSKSPVNFWSGDDVKASEISDVKAFNCANGFIWAFFTLPQLIAAILFPVNTVNANFAANIFQVGGVLVGMPAAIIAYKQIEKKYRNKGKAEQK